MGNPKAGAEAPVFCSDERSIAMSYGFIDPARNVGAKFQTQGKAAVAQALAIDHSSVRLQFAVNGFDSAGVH
jgi:hypothetical protein